MGKITDEKTALQCKVERGFLGRVNGSCHLPIGAYLEYPDKTTTSDKDKDYIAELILIH